MISFELDADGRHVSWWHSCSAVVSDGHGGKETVDLGMVLSTLPTNSWHVVQPEPLTVTPSIRCLGCGTHGFITEGKWVSA